MSLIILLKLIKSQYLRFINLSTTHYYFVDNPKEPQINLKAWVFYTHRIEH